MNSYKGKLLKFSIEDNKPDILSLGHRNPQGLRYDNDNNILFSTDHGPQGGDEINIDINPDIKDVKNYGWGIASYGEHYGYPVKNPKEYEAAPLYKSHEKYGFIEPLTYFVPSIAITQIDFVDDSLTNQRNFFVGALGNDMEEGDMSIHNIIFNKKNYWEKESHDIIPIGERIRDLKYYDNIGLLFWAEATGSIGVLNLKND
jgi:glucose/arabinose dehydrogenase